MLQRPNAVRLPKYDDASEADWLLVMVISALVIVGTSAFAIGYFVCAAIE
jgi:hypothetical protein